MVEMKYKQVILVREDLKLPKGKLAVQSAHASLDAAMKSDKKILAKAENIPIKDKIFDKVISITSLHDFDDIEKGIGEIKRVGKNEFVFSILKKSRKFDFIENKIKKNFNVRKIIDAKKDCVFICGAK